MPTVTRISYNSSLHIFVSYTKVTSTVFIDKQRTNERPALSSGGLRVEGSFTICAPTPVKNSSLVKPELSFTMMEGQSYNVLSTFHTPTNN